MSRQAGAESQLYANRFFLRRSTCVSFHLVVLPLDDFRRNVVRRSSERVEVLSSLDEFAHAEVDDLELTVGRRVDEQKIVRLEIAVSDLMRMEVFESLADLAQHALRIALAVGASRLSLNERNGGHNE